MPHYRARTGLATAALAPGAIATSRGTVTRPSNTDPVADVLYSAAGNSADQLDVAGFQMSLPTLKSWEGVGFQPPFPEAHAEALEYAGGLVELVRIARDRALAPAGLSAHTGRAA